MPPLGEIDPNVQRPKPKCKRGPKKQRYVDRLYKLPKPVTEIHRSYSPRKRDAVLMFLVHHRIYDPDNKYSGPGGYRSPFQWEAKKMFQIPRRTISEWWCNRDKETLKKFVDHIVLWPALEKELYARFREARRLKKAVTTGWFRTVSREIFARQHPDYVIVFTFSNGWYAGFKARHQIVRRKITKQATRSPEKVREIASSFLRFVRRVTHPPKTGEPRPRRVFTVRELCEAREIEICNMMNMDETPIPFEYANGYTYEQEGEKTVSVNLDRSGWDKRQATLVLYIFADGVQRLKPKIIFHGKSDGKIMAAEGGSYSDEVTVEFNKCAYNNEILFLKWIDEEYAPLVKGSGKHLLVMDVVAFHKTPAVKAKLKELGVIPAMIPPGCTSVLQPLDTAINKPFKEMLTEATAKYTSDWEKKYPGRKWTVSDKRIMTTHTVASAARTLASRPLLVSKAFMDCGISILPDGSQDHLIRLKGIPAEDIDFTGWENAEDITLPATDVVDSLDDDIYAHECGDDSGDSEELTTHWRETFNKKKVLELRVMLKDKGLPSKGLKSELVDRLVAHCIKTPEIIDVEVEQDDVVEEQDPSLA